jgi:hypothetical protein
MIRLHASINVPDKTRHAAREAAAPAPLDRRLWTPVGRSQ